MVQFEGTVLPGYFRKASNSDKPAKTLIMIGGGETFAEGLVMYIAPQAPLARKAGAHHGVDLAYVFGNMKEGDGFDATDRQP